MDLETVFMAVKSKVRKNEITVIGALTVLSQVLVGQSANKNVAEEFGKLRLEREQLFVKKDEIQALSNKLDHVNETIQTELGRINQRVADIQGYLKKADRYQASSFDLAPRYSAYITQYPGEPLLRPVNRKRR